MEYLGWFFLIFGAIRFIVAFTNLVTNMHLPQNKELSYCAFVSILIPARNEEKNIGKLLDDLLTFDYPHFEIIVYNDNSTDNTGNIVQEYCSNNQSIKLLNGKEPDVGWLGKNYACHQLSVQAKGEILLFMDADVRVENGLLEKSMAYMQKHELNLLSIFPKQMMNNIGVQLSVPLMNWILLSLLPLCLVRLSSWKSFSAANGQFMMFNTHTYKQIFPHKHFKNNKVEDIAILHYFKERKLKVATLLGDNDIRCKMYNSLHEAIEGFSKNIFEFFGGSALITILFAITTIVAPVYLYFFNGLADSILYIIFVILIRIFISLASNQSVVKNILLIIPQQIVFVSIIYTAIINKKNRNLKWKNRNIILVN
ncbi:MAG: glycosyltransferase family 2 protein [Paludibacter sp.]